MKTIMILLFLSSLTSCSFFQKREIDYSESFVTGIGIEKLSSEDISNNLKRKRSMAGGNYIIHSFPMTKAYIQAIAREKQSLHSLNEREFQQIKNDLDKKFIQNKFCLKSDIEIKEFSQVNNLKAWKLTLIDSDNISYPLDWVLTKYNKTQEKPITSTRVSYHGKEKMWLISGRACTRTQADLKKGFKVIFEPLFVQWPFPSTTEILWSFNYTEILDGKKIFHKKKERKKEAYRGW